MAAAFPTQLPAYLKEQVMEVAQREVKIHINKVFNSASFKSRAVQPPSTSATPTPAISAPQRALHPPPRQHQPASSSQPSARPGSERTVVSPPSPPMGNAADLASISELVRHFPTLSFFADSSADFHLVSLEVATLRVEVDDLAHLQTDVEAVRRWSRAVRDFKE